MIRSIPLPNYRGWVIEMFANDGWSYFVGRQFKNIFLKQKQFREDSLEELKREIDTYISSEKN